MTNKEHVEDKGELDLVELPYINEKIFKVAKAITQHLSDVLKTNAGIFDETVEVRFLRTLRQKAEDSEKNNKNMNALNQMLDSINQICYDSKGNAELYWLFIFSKRLSKLVDQKIEILEKINEHKIVKEEIANVTTIVDKGSLRLTNVKDKMSHSINFDDVKSVLVSPYKRDTRVDSRFQDLIVKERNGTIRRIPNSGSMTRLHV